MNGTKSLQCVHLFNWYIGYCIFLYRVIRKSLRDFRSLRYSSRDGHAEGEHVNRGTDTPKLGEILYLLICSFLLCLSWLLRSRVRKFRRELWIYPVHGWTYSPLTIVTSVSQHRQQLRFRQCWSVSLWITHWRMERLRRFNDDLKSDFSAKFASWKLKKVKRPKN